MTGELKGSKPSGMSPPDNRPPENTPVWRIESSDGRVTFLRDEANDKGTVVVEKNGKDDS